jgi:hypothetical protein
MLQHASAGSTPSATAFMPGACASSMTRRVVDGELETLHAHARQHVQHLHRVAHSRRFGEFAREP